MTLAALAAPPAVYNKPNNEMTGGPRGDTNMQQAIYNNSINGARNTNLTMTTASAARPSGLVRWVARRWDMGGVLALMGSSAAYGAFALAHLGL